MNRLLLRMLRRMRPTYGWAAFTLAAFAVISPALAETQRSLNLPFSLLGWAGLVGLLLGLWSGTTGRSGAWRGLRLLFSLFLIVGSALVLILLSEQALPPFAAFVQDLRSGLRWIGKSWADRAFAPQPPILVAIYGAESLPRVWERLLSAPFAGEAGAVRLVTAGGISGMLLGGWMLGWGLSREGWLFGWSLPLLATLAALTILGGGSGLLLMLGLAALLVLVADSEMRRRQRRWEQRGIDYSNELHIDLLVWGSSLAVGIVLLAWLIPASLENPLANLLWRNVEPPSGLAALERQMETTNQTVQRPVAKPGLSTLPALSLGQSLAQGPDDQISLRIQVSEPLSDSTQLYYWRARIFTEYRGRAWRTEAQIQSEAALPLDTLEIPGTITQQMIDLREDRTILVGLANPIGFDIPTNTERAYDGTLIAVTATDTPERYQVLSSLPVAAPVTSIPELTPVPSAYLALPEQLPSRVRTLASAITAEQVGQYQQALALEQYLRGLPYSYEVAPLPADGDAVDQFLFAMRQGYCSYYASAMVVMARSLGIPSRLAIGYATGTWEPETQSYVVKEGDAHAWPELYLDGRWLAFEPTPVLSLPNRAAPQQPRTAPVTTDTPEVAAPSGMGPLIWLLVGLALLGMSWLGWRIGRPAAALPIDWQVQRDFERLGQQLQVAWNPGTTLREYGALLTERLQSHPTDMALVTDLLEQAHYRDLPLSRDESRQLSAAWQRIVTVASQRSPGKATAKP